MIAALALWDEVRDQRCLEMSIPGTGRCPESKHVQITSQTLAEQPQVLSDLQLMESQVHFVCVLCPLVISCDVARVGSIISRSLWKIPAVLCHKVWSKLLDKGVFRRIIPGRTEGADLWAGSDQLAVTQLQSL